MAPNTPPEPLEAVSGHFRATSLNLSKALGNSLNLPVSPSKRPIYDASLACGFCLFRRRFGRQIKELRALEGFVEGLLEGLLEGFLELRRTRQDFQLRKTVASVPAFLGATPGRLARGRFLARIGPKYKGFRTGC